MGGYTTLHTPPEKMHCRANMKEVDMGGRKRIYAEEYEKFIKEEHKCQCGCGNVLKPSYSVFFASMKTYNVPPRYLLNHWQRKQRVITNKEFKRSVIEYNGCKIMLLEYDERCEKSYRCENYLDCLNHIILMGAEGWKVV